jgi:release factor glutamine methyltransferase
MKQNNLKEDRPEKWTVRNLLQWTTDFFQQKGFTSPRLNAEVLLAHVLGMDRLGIYLQYEKEISSESRGDFRGIIRRRLEGEPLQYITGMQEFWSLSFSVSPHTLIPRPESEHLIEVVLKCLVTIPLKENERLRILDIGTGCGNLAITLSKEIPSAWILAIDLSARALKVARMNAKRLLAFPGVNFICADLMEGLHREKARFHIILSNPPYIPTSELEKLDSEVLDHEPLIALDGGEDGLRLQRKIIQNAHEFLCGDAYLILEIGQGQAEPLIREIQGTGCYGNHKVYPDFAGRDRVLVIQKHVP